MPKETIATTECPPEALPRAVGQEAGGEAPPRTSALLEELRAALERGDRRAALRALMTAYGTVVHGYCVRVLEDRTLAADVHQQVFEEAYRDLAKLRRTDMARSWLFGIANHRCLDAVKARRRTKKRFSADDDGEVLDALAADVPDPMHRLDEPALARALDACLRTLSAEVRMAVLLRFQEELTYEDMGRMCREKPATLQARVARTLPALRRCLEKRGIQP
jgi:RNA polymerase sigma-70 factor (ECF subfamily)